MGVNHHSIASSPSWLFLSNRCHTLGIAHCIPISPELEEADGGEAGEEKASDDDQKTTFLLASFFLIFFIGHFPIAFNYVFVISQFFLLTAMVCCNQNISYFIVAVFSCAKCKAQNCANRKVNQRKEQERTPIKSGILVGMAGDEGAPPVEEPLQVPLHQAAHLPDQPHLLFSTVIFSFLSNLIF